MVRLSPSVVVRRFPSLSSVNETNVRNTSESSLRSIATSRPRLSQRSCWICPSSALAVRPRSIRASRSPGGAVEGSGPWFGPE